MYFFSVICLALSIIVIIYTIVFCRWYSKIQEIIRESRLQDEEHYRRKD